MRLVCTLVCLFLVPFGWAAEWRNDEAGCSANLPDTPGWQPIDAPSTPSITVLAAMQHPQKQAVFGINVLHQLPSTNLRDPATVATIEKSLRDLGYQFFGRSTINVAGREWMQFPVRGTNPPTSGIIRYTSANDRIYVVSLLRGGGQEAAQDPELQAAAASVRISQPQAVVATAPAAPPVTSVPGATGPGAPAAPTTTATSTASETEEQGASGNVQIGPVTLTRQQLKLGIYGVAGLIILVILLKIVGGSGSRERQR